MKAIVRNFLLAIIISTFAFFGALGGSGAPYKSHAKLSVEQIAARDAERQKETFTCLGVAALAWVLCFWRCSVINRRLNEERLYKQRFNDYMRANAFQRQYR
jgi:hypothetical protein